MNADNACTHEIEAAAAKIRAMFAAGVRAVDPVRAVRDALTFRDGALASGESAVAAPAGVHIVAVGKAAVAMTQGALEALGEQVVSGDVITKDGHVNRELPARIRVHLASHPIPDQRGVTATLQTLEALARARPGTAVLALISGGGSALMEAPRDGISLEELATTTSLLLRAGAPIGALNAVRAPLSRVKAGGLRLAAPVSPYVTLVLSDVLGNDPRTIASGPTVLAAREGPSAMEIVDQYGVRDRLPAPVLAALSGTLPSTAVALTDQDILRVIGDNAAAVAAAAMESLKLGLRPRVVWRAAEGEASGMGRDWVAMAASVQQNVDVLLGGGEATVTVRGQGIGGRNTEFALAAAIELEQRGMDDWVVASLATDGQDALTGVAGAIADARTCERARRNGVDPRRSLAANDSLAVFEAAGGAVVIGPTGTNVNDLYFAVRTRCHVARGRGGD